MNLKEWAKYGETGICIICWWAVTLHSLPRGLWCMTVWNLEIRKYQRWGKMCIKWLLLCCFDTFVKCKFCVVLDPLHWSHLEKFIPREWPALYTNTFKGCFCTTLLFTTARGWKSVGAAVHWNTMQPLKFSEDFVTYWDGMMVIKY